MGVKQRLDAVWRKHLQLGHVKHVTAADLLQMIHQGQGLGDGGQVQMFIAPWQRLLGHDLMPELQLDDGGFEVQRE